MTHLRMIKDIFLDANNDIKKLCLPDTHPKYFKNTKKVFFLYPTTTAVIKTKPQR